MENKINLSVPIPECNHKWIFVEKVRRFIGYDEMDVAIVEDKYIFICPKDGCDRRKEI